MSSQQLSLIQPSTSDMLLAAVRDATVDPAKLREIWNIKREVDAAAAAIEFKAAMSRVQARVPRINKQGKIVVPGKEGRTGHSTPYALYEDLDTAIRPIIQEEGFSESFTAEPTAQGTIWHCIVSHREGHQERYSTPPLPADKTGSKNEVQAVFSSNSYAKRYLRTNIWNIITVGVDDDGNATSFLTDAQIGNISDMANACELKAGTKAYWLFLKYAEADSIDHIQQRRFESCMAMLRQMLAKKEGR